MSYRDPDGGCSNRSLLAKALIEDTKNKAERILLTEYHAIIAQINDDERMLSNLNKMRRENPSLANETKSLAEAVAKRISINDKKLIELEQKQPLRDVLAREMNKYRQRQKQRDEEFLERQRREIDTFEAEILLKYERDRQQAIAQRQNEKNSAIQNRIEATVISSIRENKIKIIILSIIIILAVIFIVVGARNNAYRAELRNFATETMNDSFTNVYADVVSIEPEYFVYKYDTTKYGTKIGNGDLSKIVCRCKTVEGKTIWAIFYSRFYPGGEYYRNEEDYKPFAYSYDNPMRLVGGVDEAHQVVDELEDSIGNVFVLVVRETSK